jgi:hypothetical protein
VETGICHETFLEALPMKFQTNHQVSEKNHEWPPFGRKKQLGRSIIAQKTIQQMAIATACFHAHLRFFLDT